MTSVIFPSIPELQNGKKNDSDEQNSGELIDHAAGALGKKEPTGLETLPREPGQPLVREQQEHEAKLRPNPHLAQQATFHQAKRAQASALS